MRTYSIIVDPDPEGGFTVTVPALPGCITQGETVEECMVNAQEAISFYLKDLAASEEPISEETAPPRLLQVTVGRVRRSRNAPTSRAQVSTVA